MLETIFFYFFAAIAVVSAVAMVTRREAAHAAVFLATTLLATGGIIFQLHATFLFFVQVIGYAGGLLLVFCTAIRMTMPSTESEQVRSRTQKLLALLVGLGLTIELGVVLLLARRLPGEGTFFPKSASAEKLPPNIPALATSLSNDYLLPFELTGILLLLAVIGVVLMLRNRKVEES